MSAETLDVDAISRRAGRIAVALTTPRRFDFYLAVAAALVALHVLNGLVIDRRPWDLTDVLPLVGAAFVLVVGRLAAHGGVRRATTELQIAEEELLRLASIVAESNDAIIGADLEGRITNWNAAAERMYGYTAAEAIGMNLDETAPPDRVEEVRRNRNILAQGGLVQNFETVRRRKDGTLFDISLTLSPVRDANGRAVGYAGIGREITERKRIEEHLRGAQKMEAVGQLAGGVAHDFNNSLMAIRGYSELMLRRLEPNDPLRQDAEAIHKAAEGATALTRQLLAFSRKQLLQPRLLDLNSIVEDTEDMLRSLAGEHIEVRTELASGLASVRADPGQLEQVLVNLVLNARDAMAAGGILALKTADVEVDERPTNRLLAPGSYVLLAVRDTGCGMTPQVQRRAFEPFFTTKEAGRGTGMGLASVYGIVKQSGGFIWIDSEPGRGSTVRIYLPSVTEELALGPGRAPVVESPAPGGAETVLLVEDDDPVRGLLRKMLERKGYTVLESSDGESALTIAAGWKGELPLVVSDVVMPRMSGPEFAERLREVRPDAKVLFVSGYTGDTIVQHGLLEDGVMFMQKPFSAELLARKVRAILDSAALGDTDDQVLTIGGPLPIDR